VVNFKTLSMAIAGAACVTIGSAVAPSSAQAVTMTNDLQVDVTTGSLAGQSFFGSFQYDDAALTGIGEEMLDLSTGLLGVSFNFLGTIYTEQSDVELPDFPLLGFQDGSLFGLDFVVRPPAVTSDPQRGIRFFAITFTEFRAAFVSEPAIAPPLPFTGSEGTVTYGSATAVPAPAVFPGVLAAGALGAVYRKRQAKKVSA